LGCRVVEIDQEQRESLRFVSHLLDRRRPRGDDGVVAHVDPRRPDLTAVDDVLVTVSDRSGLNSGGFGACLRLGQAEGLDREVPRRDTREYLLFQFLAAVADDRKDVIRPSVDRLGSAEAASVRGDFLHHHDGFLGTHPSTAVLLGDECAQPAVVDQLVNDFVWVLPVLRLPPPVRVVVPFTDLANALLDQELALREVEFAF
jgi:hypothetical protein